MLVLVIENFWTIAKKKFQSPGIMELKNVAIQLTVKK